MKDLAQNSDQDRFLRILNNKNITPTDVGFLLGSGVREFRSFLLDRARSVFADGAVDEYSLEDVVQGLLLEFQSNQLRKFRGRAKLSTYVITCVVNRVRSKFTQLTKQNKTETALGELNSSDNSLVNDSACSANKSESKDLQHYVLEQIKSVAASFVSSLSLEDKTLLRLRYEEKVKWKAIAGILGCKVDTAKRRRDRIIEKLKTKAFPEFLNSILEETKDENLCTQILYRSIAMNQPYEVIAKELKVKELSLIHI